MYAQNRLYITFKESILFMFVDFKLSFKIICLKHIFCVWCVIKKNGPMDTTDKYVAITKYLSDVSIASIFFMFLVIVKKMDPMDTTDKYVAITKYLSVVSIGSIFFLNN